MVSTDHSLLTSLEMKFTMASKQNLNDSSIGVLQQLVSIGALVKTLAGFLIATAIACLSAYDHFAKSKELDKVVCQLNYQTKINNQQINASSAISTALESLNLNLKNKNLSKDSTEILANQISDTITKINAAIKTIDDVRENASAECEKGSLK